MKKGVTMRDILFQGKLVDEDMWVEGFYVRLHDSKGRESHRIYPGYAEKDCGDYYPDWYEVDPATVGQYTGLTANGKKIFEGYVGRYRQTDGAKRNGAPILCTGKVVYNTKTASYAVESRDEAGCKYFDYFPIKDFEVIGNIHDNPDLLKGGTKE